MKKLPFDSESSQAERRAVLKNEREASTYSQFAIADDSGGRFKNQTPRMTVGATAAPQYPPQPAGSPWNDEEAIEPPLGFSVDEMVPVGEAHEVAASLSEANPPRDGDD